MFTTTTKTNDQETMRKVVADDAADCKKLTKMEAELEGLRPRWLQVQERIEQLCSQYQNNDRSYARGVHEEFWRAREEQLKSEIETLVSERDNLTASNPSAITALKARIHNRRALVTGDFGSWVVQIADRLPQPQGSDLVRARAELNGLTDLGEIFARIQQWVARVGEIDAGPAPVALLNVAGIIRRLAAN